MSGRARAAAGQKIAVGAFAAMSLAGIVGLAAGIMLGFEELNHALLIFSSVLLFAPPLALLVHLSTTRELTRAEKRIWLRQLIGRCSASAWSEYLTCKDRRAALRRLSEEDRARRASQEGRHLVP